MNLTSIKASYKAWASKNGKHETQAEGSRQWNDEILEKANSVMEDQWATLFEVFDMEIDRARESINQELTELRNQLCGVYYSKNGVLLCQVAKMSFRSSNFPDFDCDA